MKGKGNKKSEEWRKTDEREREAGREKALHVILKTPKPQKQTSFACVFKEEQK